MWIEGEWGEGGYSIYKMSPGNFFPNDDDFSLNCVFSLRENVTECKASYIFRHQRFFLVNDR
jgi:hypothetical protein